MTSSRKIKYYLHNEIDKSKWDRCIERSTNGLIYAQSFYLDVMAGRWDALILNDYEAVMPLTWNRKFGFYYLYQPYFIPSLGVFGPDKKVIIDDFLMAIPRKFKYWQIKCNESNSLGDSSIGVKLNSSLKTNHLLNLNRSYLEINAGYKRLCLRMIKKAEANNINIVRAGTPADVIEFYRKLYENKHQGISSTVYHNLVVCTNNLFEQRHVKIYLARLAEGEIVAAYLLLVDDKHVYSLVGGSSEKGKNTGSFYLLTDAAIKDHAGSKRSFRFEGSDIPGIAFFDSQFNPEVIQYMQLTRNTLPFPFRLFK